MWQPYVLGLNQVLCGLEVSDADGTALDAENAMRRWLGWTRHLRRDGACLYLVGNGASASMAAHFAADMAKNAAVRTRSLTETSLLTAVANDIAYERVFAEPLSWWMQPADMLVTISSSGNSANIIQAIEAGRAASGGGWSRSRPWGRTTAVASLGDLNFYLPAGTYGMAESAHAVLLHCWMDAVEAAR